MQRAWEFGKSKSRLVMRRIEVKFLNPKGCRLPIGGSKQETIRNFVNVSKPKGSKS